MSQLNNEENNTDINKGKLSKEKIENKKNVKEKHGTRNMMLFLIGFTIVCVGVTIFLILRSGRINESKNLTSTESVKIENEENKKIQPASDGLGLNSLKETYKMNLLNIEYNSFSDGVRNEERYYQEYQVEGQYVQINGLKNKEIEKKINEELKEEVLNSYKNADLEEYETISIYSNCTANFANVLSVEIYTYMYHYESDNSENNEMISKYIGLNYDLSTGNKIEFEDLFTSDAAIKNIITNSAYESFYGGNADWIDYSSRYHITQEDDEYYKNVEEEVFKTISKYNREGVSNFSFSPRTITIYFDSENEYPNIVNINIKEYYNQIAIYNRYKNANDLYDGSYKEILPNAWNLVCVSSSNGEVTPDVKLEEPMYINYFNLEKISSNLLLFICEESWDNLSNKGSMILTSNELKSEITELINEYKETNDGYARFVQMRVYKYSDEEGEIIDIDEFIVDSKFAERHFDCIMNAFQNGAYMISEAYEEYLDYSIWKNDVQLGKMVQWSKYQIELNSRTNEWEKKKIYENGEYVEDVYSKNNLEESSVVEENEEEEKYEGENVEENDEENEQGESDIDIVDNSDTNDQSNSNGKVNNLNSKIIVIDPGHQTKGNSEQEPIGPGATQTKAKVTGGATGVATGQTEYALNLKVALLLKQRLETKGYTVIMTRTTNDVNISNKERAEIANNANATAFVRIHANSSSSSSATGTLTMCQTTNNPYNGDLADESYKLSKAILDNIVKRTGSVNRGVTRTDDMSGINWCNVPSTIVEMGFLSNSEEDKLLADESYQEKIVAGIVAGLEEFLESI